MRRHGIFIKKRGKQRKMKMKTRQECFSLDFICCGFFLEESKLKFLKKVRLGGFKDSFELDWKLL